jgi:hypothetical protein
LTACLDFDMLYLTGQNHGLGILGSQHYRHDYFGHYLMGVKPPDWNEVSRAAGRGRRRVRNSERRGTLAS